MYGFETCVVVHEDKQVLIARVMRSDKWAGDVGVDEATSVRRFVERGIVGVTGRIRRSARSASVETTVSESGRRIGGNGGQCTQSRGSCVRHYVDVMVGARSVDGVAALKVRSVGLLGFRSARLHPPFEKPPRPAER
eukprot:4878939-Pleurochrysis_carterae.AAC.1